MPLSATATRAQLADTARNPRRTVVGGEVVHVELVFDNREFRPEELFDALADHYNAWSLTTALAGANNDLTFTSKPAVDEAGEVTITYVVAGASTPLTVDVTGKAITVNVATNGGSAATSTAAQVLAAVNAKAEAAALVTASLAPSNSGAGVVTALATTALDTEAAKVTLDTDTAGQRQFRFRIK